MNRFQKELLTTLQSMSMSLISHESSYMESLRREKDYLIRQNQKMFEMLSNPTVPEIDSESLGETQNRLRSYSEPETSGQSSADMNINGTATGPLPLSSASQVEIPVPLAARRLTVSLTNLPGGFNWHSSPVLFHNGRWTLSVTLVPPTETSGCLGEQPDSPKTADHGPDVRAEWHYEYIERHDHLWAHAAILRSPRDVVIGRYDCFDESTAITLAANLNIKEK